MKSIKIRSFGPIKEADINFGDLTFFVGPQASGKSIVLQLIKLIADKTSIETKLENHGFVWSSNLDDSLERFFGEGMAGIWDKKTDVDIDGVPFLKSSLSPLKKGVGFFTVDREKLFYIPAQRVLCLNFGWPRFFTDFDDSVPYVLRDFSENIRQFVETNFTHGQPAVFPQKGYGNDKLDESFDDSIFHGGKITVEISARKRFKLNIGESSLPFMTWSTGQKEFLPLLIAFYWLCSAKSERKKGIEYVIIEEPEMGLHPDAIKSVILQIIHLMSRGYKVIVSTHSPLFLEFAWAFNILKEENASSSAFDSLFDIDANDKTKSFFDKDLIRKDINTYYFNRIDGRVGVKDISSLNAGAEDLDIADWGGLSSFASKAGEIISNIVAQNG